MKIYEWPQILYNKKLITYMLQASTWVCFYVQKVSYFPGNYSYIQLFLNERIQRKVE